MIDDRSRRPFAIGILVGRHRLLVAGPRRFESEIPSGGPVADHASHHLGQHEIAIARAARSLRRQGFIGQHFHAHSDHPFRQRGESDHRAVGVGILAPDEHRAVVADGDSGSSG